MSYFVNMQVNHFRPYKLTLDRLAELDIEFKGSNEEEREWLMDSVISSVTRSQAAYPEWKKLLSLGSHVTTIPTLHSQLTGVEEKFHKENFRVNGEMRDEILVYESIL